MIEAPGEDLSSHCDVRMAARILPDNFLHGGLHYARDDSKFFVHMYANILNLER